MGRPGDVVAATGVELVDLLTSTQRALTRALAALFDDEGVSLDQWRILRAVSGESGRQMGELATLLEIPAATVTRLVDGLVDTAHLYRTHSTEDRRRVSVRLSPRGQQLLARLEAIASAHERSVATLCGPEQVDQLVTALRAIRDRLT